MDPARHNAYKLLVPRSGSNALLAWHARGLDLASPTFRLFGVRALALVAPLDEPGWELVAAPDPQASTRFAECWVYRALAPLPRAFAVSQVVSVEELKEASLELWDPLAVACLEVPARPAQPFSSASVDPPRFLGNDEVRVRAELDGDGLLILTEEAFPGWSVEVDGEPAELLRADALFRAVMLSEGEHEVVFRYWPRTLTPALWLSAGALVGLLLVALRKPRAE